VSIALFYAQVRWPDDPNAAEEDGFCTLAWLLARSGLLCQRIWPGRLRGQIRMPSRVRRGLVRCVPGRDGDEPGSVQPKGLQDPGKPFALV
jgi:hypothetical protein